MSLRNFQVDGNVTDADLLKLSNGFLKKLVTSFRQAAANGNFTFGLSMANYEIMQQSAFGISLHNASAIDNN